MEEIKLKGAILILSGPSGAGKSSLYKALAKEYFGQACDNKYQKGCDMYKQLN